MVENNELFAQIDKFIADLLNGDIEVIYSRAKGLDVLETWKGILGSKKHDVQGTLPSHLGKAITIYMENKTDSALHLISAMNCMKYIVWAYTHDVIKKTGLITTIKELRKENFQLKEEKDKLQRENNRLTQLNDALYQTIDKLGLVRIDDRNDEGKQS